MRVCHVVASINRDTGGPAITVPRLASALSSRGIEVDLATLDYPQHGPQTVVAGVTVSSTPTSWANRALRGWSSPFRRGLRSLVGDGVDLIHNHGLWMFPNLYARQTAKAARIPLVISPRGMVEPWSLRNSSIKKKIVWSLFEKGNLQSADLFHATSMAEADSIRSLGIQQPIAVIPNGIEVPDLAQRPDRSLLENLFPELRNRQWLVFLSRLHPKKGVLELLAAWKRLATDFPGWHLILAGPDLDGFEITVRNEIATLGLNKCVTVTGMLNADHKQSAFVGAELFVLPTHSENFGVAVAEALAHAVPVLTTHGAPWSGLIDHRCGWWIEFTPQKLIDGLGAALKVPREERVAMGLRGRDWMARDFSWDKVAEQMQLAYTYALGKAPAPDFVLNHEPIHSGYRVPG